MKGDLSYRIRKLRESKDFTPKDMGAELGISPNAYSKIERGESALSVKRLEEIAKILGVSMNSFFPDEKEIQTIEDPAGAYGLATKTDIHEIYSSIAQLKHDIANIKNDIIILNIRTVKQKK